MVMDSGPLVSVVIPMYNAQKHLRECLESILCQNYAHIEIIAVDDGSTDLSPRICDDISSEDSRVRAIPQHNQGVACARNTGLGASKGEYVTFVDSDDWLEADAIASLVSEAQVHDSDVVVGGYLRHIVGADEREVTSKELPGMGGGLLDTNVLSDPQCARRVCDLDIAGHLYQCWGKLFRRPCINGLRFQPGCSCGEDVVFVLDVLRRGVSISVLSKVLYNYREESGSLVRGFRMSKVNDFEFNHGRHIDFYKDLPITDDQRRAIDTRLANDVLWAISAVRQAPDAISLKDRLHFIDQISRSPWRDRYLHSLKAAHVDRLTKIAFLLNNGLLWRAYLKMGR